MFITTECIVWPSIDLTRVHESISFSHSNDTKFVKTSLNDYIFR